MGESNQLNLKGTRERLRTLQIELQKVTGQINSEINSVCEDLAAAELPEEPSRQDSTR
jgi:hypothetical protein